MRNVYPSDKIKNAELLAALKKVSDISFLIWFWPNLGYIWDKKNYFVFQADPIYNALEKDIAVVNLYFGSSTVYGNGHVDSNYF